MSRDASGRWTSTGRHLLVAALQNSTATAIAKACSVTPAAISALSTGQHRWPSLVLAIGLERYGIGSRTWLDSPATVSTAIEAPPVILFSKPHDAA